MPYPVYLFSLIPLSATVFISWDAQRGTSVSLIKPKPVLGHHATSAPPTGAPTSAPSLHRDNQDQAPAPVLGHHGTARDAASAPPTSVPSALPTSAPTSAPSMNDDNQDQVLAIKDLMHRSRNMFGQPTFSHTNFTWNNGSGNSETYISESLPITCSHTSCVFLIYHIIMHRIVSHHVTSHYLITHPITHIVSIAVDVSSIIYANAWIPFPIHVHGAALDVGVLDLLDDPATHMGPKRPDSSMWTVRY